MSGVDCFFVPEEALALIPYLERLYVIIHRFHLHISSYTKKDRAVAVSAVVSGRVQRSIPVSQ